MERFGLLEMASFTTLSYQLARSQSFRASNASEVAGLRRDLGHAAQDLQSLGGRISLRESEIACTIFFKKGSSGTDCVISGFGPLG